MRQDMTASEETEWLAFMLVEAQPHEETSPDKVARMKAALMAASGSR